MSDLIVRVRSDTAQVDAALVRLDGRLAAVESAGKTAMQPVTEGAQKAARATREAEQATGSWSGRLGSLAAGGAAAFALTWVTNKVQETARALLDAQIQSERLAIGLQFAVGPNAGRDLSWLRDVTEQLGLEFNSTAKAYGGLAAASRGTRLEGAGARQVFEAVAKASAVMGLSAEQSSGALLALQQMISKGTVQAEELRGQLGERLPGAFQIAARSMGMTTAELSKMLELGGLITEDFLPKFGAQLLSEVGGATERAGQRAEASLNRLSNAWENFKRTVAQSGAGDATRVVVDDWADSLRNMTERMEEAKESGGGFWSQLGALGVAILQSANPFDALTGRALSLSGRLNDAREDLAKLETQLTTQPNNLLLKNAIKDTRELIAELEKVQVAGDNALSAFGTQGSADNQAARLDRDARARIARDAQAVLQSLSGVDKDYVPNLLKLNRALEVGEISLNAYREAVAQLVEKQAGGAQAAKSWRREQEAAAKAFDDALLDSWKIIWADAEKQAEAARKALEEENKSRAAYGAELAKGVAALDDEIAARRAGLVEMNLTGAALARLRQAQVDTAIAAEERKLGAVELDDAERRAIELRIERLRELRRLEGERGDRLEVIERDPRNPRDGTRAADGWMQVLDDYMAHVSDAAAQVENIFAVTAQGVEDAFLQATRTGKLSFSSMLRDMGDELLRSTFRKLMQELLKTEAVQDGLWAVFQAFGGGMATGGRPQMGRAYLVGEQGPELFVPDHSGTVVPNHQLGAAAPAGGPTVVVQQHVEISIDASTDRAQVAAIVDRGMRASEARIYESLRRDGAMARG